MRILAEVRKSCYGSNPNAAIFPAWGQPEELASTRSRTNRCFRAHYSRIHLSFARPTPQWCRFEKILIKSKIHLWNLLTFWCFIGSLDPNGQADTPLMVWHLSDGFLESPKNLHLLHKKGYFGKLPCPPLPNSVYMAIKAVPTTGMTIKM